ncbi:transposase [Defluviimonas sp. WL0050]|uniref:Transposase n=1 Tax=Albidovulum litorale TaxID=2984134 RepID=A0ABT2ZNB2_9RHOB|nr:transposase [Defluviimonas sp. WL0050]MCV2872623.1 transposase [Defluviimonas sp. WL0050]
MRIDGVELRRFDQDNRFIKKRTRPILGFKSFVSVAAMLKGI